MLLSSIKGELVVNKKSGIEKNWQILSESLNTDKMKNLDIC